MTTAKCSRSTLTMLNEQAWPPQSPIDAFLSSPRGKKEYCHSEQIRRSPVRCASKSPEFPMKTPTMKHVISREKKEEEEKANSEQDADDDDEEEILQLQLQAIKARLKIKQLQRQRTEIGGKASMLDSNASTYEKCEKTQLSSKNVVSKESESNAVHVPLSPAKRSTMPIQEPRSPGRVLLGIDKGKRGKDVSLRRPSPMPKEPSVNVLRNSSKTIDTNPPRVGAQSNSQLAENKFGRPFNERMAIQRQNETKSMKERQRSKRLQEQRSTAFELKKTEQDAFKEKAYQEQNLNHVDSLELSHSFSRAQIIAAAPKQPTTSQQRIGNTKFDTEKSVQVNRVQSMSHSTLHQQTSSKKTTQADEGLLEPFSATHLSRRILPQDVVVKMLKRKKIVDMTTMLQHVKKPDWELPESVVDDSTDFLVFGIVGKKSAPLDHKTTSKSTSKYEMTVKSSIEEAERSLQNDQKKYMVMTLVSPDLRWSIDLYLFATAFTRWRMITEGTLVAVLNPSIMPPPPGKVDTNRWSMKLTSSEETVLEIGTSSHIGWCKAIKRSGEQCRQWIDGRRLTYCEWHMSQGIARAKSSRMETQSTGLGPKRRGDHNVMDPSNRYKRSRSDKNTSDVQNYDWASQSSYYVSSTGMSRESAASLIVAEDVVRDRSMSQAEKTRNMLCEREKEAQMAFQLGASGRGAGAEYMRTRKLKTVQQDKVSEKTARRLDEQNSIGSVETAAILSGRGVNISLSPLKKTERANRWKTPDLIKHAGPQDETRSDAKNLKRANDLEDESDELDIV